MPPKANRVLNPNTGRYVNRNGRVGKTLTNRKKDKAAVQIQKHWRGKVARKKVKSINSHLPVVDVKQVNLAAHGCVTNETWTVPHNVIVIHRQELFYNVPTRTVDMRHYIEQNLKNHFKALPVRKVAGWVPIGQGSMAYRFGNKNKYKTHPVVKRSVNWSNKFLVQSSLHRSVIRRILLRPQFKTFIEMSPVFKNENMTKMHKHSPYYPGSFIPVYLLDSNANNVSVCGQPFSYVTDEDRLLNPILPGKNIHSGQLIDSYSKKYPKDLVVITITSCHGLCDKNVALKEYINRQLRPIIRNAVQSAKLYKPKKLGKITYAAIAPYLRNKIQNVGPFWRKLQRRFIG